MTLSFPAIQVLRAKLTVVALGAMVATAGHAVAKNHDNQAFRLPCPTLALHDRAPGPSPRLPD